jgi:hypothetical protein
MARQRGVIQLTGILGGVSFYKHRKYGMLARMCNPVSAQRIATDPAFARTRENGTEFGMVSRAGSLLRHGLLGFLRDVSTADLDLRVMQLLMRIKSQDTVNARGQRQVGAALALHPELLGGFEFNKKCGLGRFVVQRPVVDVAGGTITLKDFLCDQAPKKATHVVVTGFRGRVDFGKGERDFRFSEEVVIPIASTAAGADATLRGRNPLSDISVRFIRTSNQLLPSRDVVLTLPEPQGETGTEFWGIKLVFLQEVNGVRYTLKTGAAAILASHPIAIAAQSLLVVTPDRGLVDDHQSSSDIAGISSLNGPKISRHSGAPPPV